MTPKITTWAERNEIMRVSPDAKKAGLAKGTILALSAFSMSVLQACSPVVQDANAQTAPPAAEHEMPEAEIKQYAENTAEPKIMDASFSTPEISEQPASLDELLEAGKAEWMQNATPEYGEDTEFLWEDSLGQITKIGATTMDWDIASDLKKFTPNMVREFAELSDDDYPYLESLWKEFRAKAREDESKAREERFKKLVGKN